MFIVIELQTDAQGQVATLVFTKATLNEAESTYHTILAAAALSTLPKHGAVVLTDEGYPLYYQFYAHEPAPVPNNGSGGSEILESGE